MLPKASIIKEALVYTTGAVSKTKLAKKSGINQVRKLLISTKLISFQG